ncbi:MAG: hypothetical protein ACE5DM_01165 [Candidatus Nanoarchaeia archaeon]
MGKVISIHSGARDYVGPMHSSITDAIDKAAEQHYYEAQYNFELRTSSHVEAGAAQRTDALFLKQLEPWGDKPERYEQEHLHAGAIEFTLASSSFTLDKPTLACRDEQRVYLTTPESVKGVLRKLRSTLDMFDGMRKTVSIKGIDYFNQFRWCKSDSQTGLLFIRLPHAYRTATDWGQLTKESIDAVVGR